MRLLLLFISIIMLGCSSSPAQVVEINASRNAALSQLELANHAANRGRFSEALSILEEGRRLAVSADDPELRIRTAISLGDILFSLGRTEEAFSRWESAALEGDAFNRPGLAALARIHGIRGSLFLLAEGEAGGITGSRTDLRPDLRQILPAARQDPLTNAAWYLTLGLAERQAGQWAEAEAAVRNALDIYERNRSLEDSAYAWFVIGSIRSLGGNYGGALNALQASISIDRRIENSYGLATSWQAIGDVYSKMGLSDDARAAFTRSAEIFRAIGFNERAELLENI
ncbi:MAG: tetratricopeptide repeat protein [Treponema sp.]|nr:tetratricopeptide repeat protein [Treponema sp.]